MVGHPAGAFTDLRTAQRIETVKCSSGDLLALFEEGEQLGIRYLTVAEVKAALAG